MVPRQMDFQTRRDKILVMTIDQYIRTVLPVSSSYIAQASSLDLSSATIRNILADLEKEGYLMHPHTSAGRVPTEKGYRYYVDNLMQDIELLEDEKDRIKTEYETQSKELENLLDKTSQAISELTHYTSIVSVDGWGNKLFCRGANYVVNYSDYQDLARIESILAALDQKETLLEIINQDLAKRINILIGQEIDYSQIDNCSLVISEYKMKNGPSGRMAVLGPTRMSYKRVVSALDYFTELMDEIL